MSLFKQFNIIPYLKYAVAAAIVYAIPVIIYLTYATYEQIWLVYLGNLLFLGPIAAFLYAFNRKRKENAGTVVMLTAGHITTILGIIISCAICFLLLALMVPGYLGGNDAAQVMEDAPANTTEGGSNGIGFMVFANAIIGNFSAGSFVSIVYPFSLKSDQTKEKVPKRQAEL